MHIKQHSTNQPTAASSFRQCPCRSRSLFSLSCCLGTNASDSGESLHCFLVGVNKSHVIATSDLIVTLHSCFQPASFTSHPAPLHRKALEVQRGPAADNQTHQHHQARCLKTVLKRQSRSVHFHCQEFKGDLKQSSFTGPIVRNGINKIHSPQ